jgi:hypothetical protein
MKKTLLLLLAVVATAALQAQSPDLDAIKSLMERLMPSQRVSVTPSPASAREIISCIRETVFNTGQTGAGWDSTFRNVTLIDEVNDYRVLIQESYTFDEVTGFELIFRTQVYGVDAAGSTEGRFDSIVQVIADENQGLLDYVKVYPTYTPAGNPARYDIYFNTGAFGLPLGFILFGQNLFYYDQNDFLIATASKQVDFTTFSMANSDSTALVNNAVGQVILETEWQWDTDFNLYEPTYRYGYTYFTPGGDLETETIEYWVGSDWEYNSHNIYTYYKPGQVSRQEIQIGEPGAWVTVQEVAYTYDAQDRLVEERESNVDFNGAKTPFYRTVHTYDSPDGLLLESISQYNDQGIWVNSGRIIQEDCTDEFSSVDEPATKMVLQAWFNSARQLELSVRPEADVRLIEVFDLSGRPVLQASLSGYPHPVDAARLQQGLYLVRVTMADGAVATHKAMQW